MRIFDFTYPNGVIQRKYLISLETYNNVVKPLLRQIEDLEDLPEKQQDKFAIRKLRNELDSVFEGRHLDIFYEVIVEGGRFGKAVETGELEPFFTGGPIEKVKIKEL